MASTLLGQPLDDALCALREAGIESEIDETCAPRGAHEEGTLRVVRALDGGRRLTVARFPDRVREAEA